MKVLDFKNNTDMKRYSLYLAAIAILLFASCETCERGGHGGGDCSHMNFVYFFNASSAKVQFGDNLVINSGEQKFLTKVEYLDFPYDTVSILFNDSILFKHIKLNNDGVVEYIPSEHNVLSYSAWEVDFIDDSYEKSWLYTITEEDYQRALEQNEK